ncbi:hypothetical protein BT63DRAFT_420033 [Microthyrium microscopicum]|uniref:Integral membrane protein-like protein n=1 Tax=Microthyrium microscopicum TaxID=703497 RepID=A0A6A6UTI5_9PEZI|nr:hypothetical protein BT63DRAFT_420033 [Microthyrium microscopicum]
MRIAAISSLVLCTVAFILAFLCIYAGNKPGFMDTPNYSIIALNTSRIGENILLQVKTTFQNDKTKLLSILNTLLKNIVSSSSSKRDLTSTNDWQPLRLEDILTDADIPSLQPHELAYLHERNLLDERGLIDDLKNKTGSIITSITGAANGVFTALTDPAAAFALAEKVIRQYAEEVGLQDFYMYHVKDYCSGQYTPTEVPNATYPLSKIERNVTECEQYLHWVPGDTVQAILNKTGLSKVNVTLDTIHWPTKLDDEVRKAEGLLNATMWLYVIVIIFAGLAALVSLIAVIWPEKLRIVTGTGLVVLTLLGFVVAAIVSIIVTAAAVMVDNAVKDLATVIGVVSTRGDGFLGLTWAATGCLFIASILGSFTCCAGRKKKRVPKHG